MSEEDALNKLAGLSLEEFLVAPFHMWAEFVKDSGMVSDPVMRRDARQWLAEWSGKYETLEAKQAFRRTTMVGLEWSTRTWHQIRARVGGLTSE